MATPLVIDVRHTEVFVGLAEEPTTAESVLNVTSGPALLCDTSHDADARSAAIAHTLVDLCTKAGIDPTGRPILISLPDVAQLSPMPRESWVTLLFDALGASAVFVNPSHVLALYATGATTGLMINSTHAVSVHEGHALSHATVPLADPVTAREAARAAHAAIMACDPDGANLVRDLQRHIVLFGRASDEWQNIQHDFETALREMPGIHPSGPRIQIAVHCEHAAWVGGSILALTQTFQPMWITRREYEIEGANIVRRKCS